MEANDMVKSYYESIDGEDKRTERESLEYIRSQKIISRYLTDRTMEIADICGATGAYSFWLAGMGHQVHLMDLAQSHIDKAKEKSRDNKITLASYSCADARKLPYANGSMDLVLLMGALYHLRSSESRVQCLREAFRVLRDGGIILCTIISRYNAIISSLKYDLFSQLNMDIVDFEEILATGITSKSRLPLSYCHTPAEITCEMSMAGFIDSQLIAVEGIANAMGDNSLPEDKVAAEQLLKCVEITESIPELLGVSRNIIAVGKKRHIHAAPQLCCGQGSAEALS